MGDTVSKAQEPDRHCGPAAVAALFAHRPADVLRFFYTPMRRQEAGPLCAALAKRRLPYREVPPEELQRIAGTTHHGGMVAVARPRGVTLLDVANLPPLLWAAPVLLPFAFAIQETCARIALVTGHGLARVIKARMPTWVLFVTVFLVALANTVNIAADLSSMAAVLTMFTPISQLIAVALIAALVGIAEIQCCPY